MDLMKLAEQYPGVSVTVRLDDLLVAGETLARRIREEVEREHLRSREPDYLVPKEEAARILGGPDPATLWRWEKRGYLAPVKIGVRVYYRRGELDRIIDGHTVRARQPKQ